VGTDSLAPEGFAHPETPVKEKEGELAGQEEERGAPPQGIGEGATAEVGREDWMAVSSVELPDDRHFNG
jgi:hypothetical protein